MKSHSESYRLSGVNLNAGYESVRRIQKHIERTTTPGVLSGIGGFGGLFQPNLSGVEEPVLVSGADGVGTKLKIAFALNLHDTIGIDCVAMCVNDVLCAGAAPLFFLDYIAMGKNCPERVEQIVSGVAEGCVRAQCALIGGETAEMPGFYPEGEYDVAGFCVGLADKKKIPSPENVKPGDVIIALPSSGVHSNGFSLIRHVFGDTKEALEKRHDELSETFGKTLLTPTRIYVEPVQALFTAVSVKGLSNITGGGFYENIPRCLPEGLMAKIEQRTIITPPIFGLIQSAGGISMHDMFNTFNMGVGMIAVVAKEDADLATRTLSAHDVAAYVIGEVAEGDGVLLC